MSCLYSCLYHLKGGEAGENDYYDLSKLNILGSLNSNAQLLYKDEYESYEYILQR